MNHKSYKFPKITLSREYFIFSGIIVAVLVLAAVILSAVIYSSQAIDNQEILSKEADHIDLVLTENFDYTNRISVYMGKQIAETGAHNLNFIYDLFKKTSGAQYKTNSMFSWSLFDWVDKNNLQLINSMNGINQNPPDMSHRDYSWKCRKEPWSLQFSIPAIGNPSGKWVIPAGTGITDKDDNYLGAIVVGFNIAQLNEKLWSVVGKSKVSYLIFDENYNLVLQSSDNKEKQSNEQYRDIIKNIDLYESRSSITPHIILNDITYSYYKKMDNFPYIILTGFSNKILEYKFTTLLLPRLIELAILGCFFIIILYFFRVHIVKPIKALSDTATRISNGETITEFPRTNSYEASNLAEQLVSVQRYIKKIHRIEERLRHAKDVAEAATKGKTEFLASTAHELRSPLNAIIGMSEVIKTKMFGDGIDRYVEYAGDIEQSGHELLEFITDLIDMSKAESGYFALDNEEVLDIENIIHRSVKLNISRANKVNIRIDIYIEESLPKLFADGRRMRQVLVNLISNSIKYSPTDTVINISAIMLNGKMKLIVADQGVGMNQEQLVVALSRWGIVTNDKSGQVDSSGLGLPLAKHLIELHGAEFLIDSTPGKGTIIKMVFPENRIKKE